METFFDISVTFATRSWQNWSSLWRGKQVLKLRFISTGSYSITFNPSVPFLSSNARIPNFTSRGTPLPFLDNRQHTASSLTVLTKWKAHRTTVSSTATLTRLSLHHCWLPLPLTWRHVIHRAVISDNTLADLVVSMRSVPSAVIFKNYAFHPRRKCIDFLWFVKNQRLLTKRH